MNLQSSVVSAFLPLNDNLNLVQVAQSFGNEPIGFHETYGFLVSKETVVLRRWGRLKQKFGFIKRVDKC